MSFYEEQVLPHLINVAMNTKAMKEERRRCLEPVSGAVLEIGFGTGSHRTPAWRACSSG